MEPDPLNPISSACHSELLLDVGARAVPTMPDVRVAIYDEGEETTCIDLATLLTANGAKRWLLTPFLSLVSLFVFPVFLYWKIPL